MRKMDLMKRCGWLLGCFFAAISITACTDEADQIEDIIPGTGFTETISLLPEAGNQVINFVANSNWVAKSNQTWLKLDGQAQSSGKAGNAELYVAYEVNETVADRTADITVSVGSTIKTIKVTQKAAGRVIAFDGVTGDTLTLQKDFIAGDVSILANVTWEYLTDSLPAADKAWIEVAVKDGKLAIKLLNQDGLKRTARLVFRDKNFASFTKALFVTVDGWGENYLAWTLGKTEFPKGGDTTKLTIKNVLDVKPMALSVDKEGNVIAEKADWVIFATAPASKTMLKEQKLIVTVDSFDMIKNRYAYIFVVPSDMMLADIVAKKDELGGVKITQLAAKPVAAAVELNRFFNNEWESVTKGFTATKLTWSMDPTTSTVVDMMSQYSLAMKIESNCTLSNPREMGKKPDGTEVELPYMNPGETPVAAMMAAKPIMDAAGYWQMKVGNSNPGFFLGISGYLIWDLLDEDGVKVGAFKYDLQCLGMAPLL